jgi:hypothetical protein
MINVILKCTKQTHTWSVGVLILFTTIATATKQTLLGKRKRLLAIVLDVWADCREGRRYKKLKIADSDQLSSFCWKTFIYKNFFNPLLPRPPNMGYYECVGVTRSEPRAIPIKFGSCCVCTPETKWDITRECESSSVVSAWCTLH